MKRLAAALVGASVGAGAVALVTGLMAPAPPPATPAAIPAAPPAAAGDAERTAAPAPAAVSLEGQPIITRVDNPNMRIAITFDACATRTHGYRFDRAVYEILQREKIPTTIFTSGRWVEFHPDVMTELAADPLIEFGNHSYDHPHMPRLDSAQIVAQIDETEAALGRYGKRSVAFRPPFGDIDDHVVAVVHGRGLPVVTWDVVSGDPSAAATKDGIIHEVDSKTRAGSIVIFHINGRGRKTAAVLPTIVRDLRARGFELVLLSTLLGSRGGAGGSAPPAPATVAAGVRGDGGGASPPSSIVRGPALCEPPAPWDRIVPESSTGEELR